MNIYIWQRVGHVSDNYHHYGGLAVIAADLEQARELMRTLRPRYSWPTDDFVPDVPSACDAYTQKPDMTYPLAGEHEPKVLVFPDAGCC